MQASRRGDRPDGTLRRGPGPAHPVNSKPLVGLTSLQPWVYDFTAEADRELVFDVGDCDLVGLVIDGEQELVYALHPVFDVDESDVRDSYAGTAVALDLEFDDGSTLSDQRLRDQHGVIVDPAAQYDSRTVSVDQWTLKRIRLSAFADRRITRVLLRITAPVRADGSRTRRRMHGFLDDVGLRRAEPESLERIHRVRTTRGTHSSDRFSRGNCAPLVASPHGSVFGLPMTDGGNR
ncbi:GH92 family glycosyl hydrolase, partial [Gordonia aichiensis]